MGGKRYGRGAGRVALTGVLAALSLVFLWISAVAPAGRLGLVAVAGVFPAGAVVSAGLGAGFFCYGATGLLEREGYWENGSFKGTKPAA